MFSPKLIHDHSNVLKGYAHTYTQHIHADTHTSTHTNTQAISPASLPLPYTPLLPPLALSAVVSPRCLVPFTQLALLEALLILGGGEGGGC